MKRKRKKQNQKAAGDSKEYSKNRTRKFSANGKLAGHGYSMITMERVNFWASEN